MNATRRVGYLLNRAKAIDLPRVWSIARAVSRVARRPAPLIFVDMFFCSVKYECAFQDYQDWDFAFLSAQERATFMTHPKSDHIARRYNVGEDRFVLADKGRFNARFAKYVRRDWVDLRTASDVEVQQFVDRNAVVMAKVPDALGGTGIEKVVLDPSDSVEDLRNRFEATGQVLLEEYVRQHSNMAALNPSSVNTIRVVTFVKRGEVHILARVLKIGAGGDVDNFSAGGMYTMLDDSGVVRFAAFDGHDSIHAFHPLTRAPIIGFAVPHFDEVIRMVKDAAREVRDVPYVGWDVAISSIGPLIIEANYNTGVFQSKPRASGIHVGLRSAYVAVIDL